MFALMQTALSTNDRRDWNRLFNACVKIENEVRARGPYAGTAGRRDLNRAADYKQTAIARIQELNRAMKAA